MSESPTSKPMELGKEDPNHLGLNRQAYEGVDSTLCKGCGHDAITASIITACHQAAINPQQVVKMSGIGCSSKTTAYFMSQAFGFNGTHGRMAPLAAGAKTANKHLIVVGVSGDGDTASIGLGNFAHMIRRNMDIAYIVENNGVYGLTKGQFSATADEHTTNKKGVENTWPGVDLASLAISMGATFVARSFSGDRKQLAPLIMAALKHRGTAILDVLSPCVTFNDHEGSTKSLANIRANRDPLNTLDFIPVFDDIQVEVKKGRDTRVRLHDGSQVVLHKLKDHDPTNRMNALTLLEAAYQERKFLTGLIYIDESKVSFSERENLTNTPLSFLTEAELRPSRDALKAINQKLMR
ncbi:MAG: 2-oxoacid:ferredoxin oxidoreductase subunit beta [Deltaproteobacteria bacterium]|nr:2-oxoacid:ferredoxin oxidoreductase subunit beta [Deltaproteobacteria bacterium]